MNKYSGENIRLMKAFQIEKNYQKHRQKLYSIQNQNARQKVSRTTQKNIDKINNYRYKRVSTDRSRDFFKNREIQDQNYQLHKTLTKVYNRYPRQGYASNLDRVNSVSSMRSETPVTRRVIEAENVRLLKSINNARSGYRKYRQNSDKNRLSRISTKQEMVRLLEKQLGEKPHFFRAPTHTKSRTNKFRIHTMQR